MVEVELDLALISSRIKFIPFSEFEKFLPQAKEICPDPSDLEYLALALRFNCSLWSDDKLLKEQDSVKVFSTSDLLEIL